MRSKIFGGEAKIIFKYLNFLLAFAVAFASQTAHSDSTGEKSPQASDEQKQGKLASLGVSEIAIANMLLYSQEYMKHFFADADSFIQPLPASGISLFTAYGLNSHSRLLFILTIPLREEQAYKDGKEFFRYYYPKMFITGYERDWFETSILDETTALRLSTSLGIGVPLSHRFLRYFPPLLLNRASVRLSKRVDLNFGVGYSGNTLIGAWFFPFGVSYRLQGE